MPLVTIEGIDGAGKSTLAAALAERLGATLLREPGGVEASERIRDLVKDPALTIGPRAEALLYAAARAQLVEETLRPALERGELVLLDRFVDSSLAYQGAGRELGVDAVRAINAFGTGGLQPDVTQLLRIDPAEGRARQDVRGEAPDRLEQAGEDFFTRIAAAYDELATREPDRIRVLDASAPPESVLAQALDAISASLGS
jgi:dTMP kinase